MYNVKAIKSFKADLLNVEIYDPNESIGQAAANFVSKQLHKSLEKSDQANLILATGASQFTFLDAFKKDESVDWSKITVFHLDEYIDMSDQHPASFRKYLRERILDEVKPARAYFLKGDAKDINAEMIRYESLLKSHPVDVACIGIGENGHIAFNDPYISDFNDPRLVKIVDLDKVSRKQQLGEGWFDNLADVPTRALSLTIPAIMNCKVISCVVPDERKANAVYKTINDPVSNACPATILKKHQNAVLFLDSKSALRLD